MDFVSYLKKCKHRDALLNYLSEEIDPLLKNVLFVDCKKLRNEITKDKRLSKKSLLHLVF